MLLNSKISLEVSKFDRCRTRGFFFFSALFLNIFGRMVSCQEATNNMDFCTLYLQENRNTALRESLREGGICKFDFCFSINEMHDKIQDLVPTADTMAAEKKIPSLSVETALAFDACAHPKPS